MTHSYIQNPAIADIVRQFETIPSDVLSEALWPTHLYPQKPKPERREACLTLLGVLLRHLDGPSLRMGTQVPGVGFVALDMKTIAQEAGLGLRRCERAIHLFLAQGFIEVKKPQGGKSIIKHSGMRAIRKRPINRIFSYSSSHDILFLFERYIWKKQKRNHGCSILLRGKEVA